MSLRRNYWLFLLSASLVVNGYIAIQWRLCSERNARAEYVIGIATAVARSKIHQGMTYDEVIERVHHDPDLVGATEKGKLCSWSAAYHYGPLERLFGYTQENGHYWLDVLFDDQGKVIEVSLTEA